MTIFALIELTQYRYPGPMRLKTVKIQNFRSIENSEEFSLDQVTSLVGKNEAGKTAVLLALAALNPHPATPVTIEKERDYPRRYLTQYRERHPKAEATVVTTTWDLSDADHAAIVSEFGNGVLLKKQVVISRAYGGEPQWSFDIDVAAALAQLCEQAGVTGVDKTPVEGATSAAEAIKALESIQGNARSKPQESLLSKLRSLIDIDTRVATILKPQLPQFMYFSTYDRMEGAVQIEELEQLNADGRLAQDQHRGRRLFHEFLTYAGIPLSEIKSISTYETFNARLQAASNNITDQILEYWTQNPDLAVNVTIAPARSNDLPPLNTGTVARARVYNSLHRVDTPFSERSAGFVWFFSFLVKFNQVKNQTVPVILLLDEPGLTLHGKAQSDLLRFFDEKLAPHHQIIYSTHSPFMIAADRLLSVRIVEDQVDRSGRRPIPIGTKVREDVLSRDADTLFPLQGALGYDITQTLFVGKHTLLVEGPSDILYLQALSAAAKRIGLEGLDSRWTLCPSGGIGNIRAFLSLFSGNHIDVTVLADIAFGQKSEIKRLRESNVLKNGRVFTLDQFTGKAEADVEDILDPLVFSTILNGTYELKGDQAIDPARLAAADTSTTRLVKQAEAHFRIHPPAVGATFDHFAPSAWLLSNLSILANSATKPTLERAAQLFVALNSVLAS